MELSGQSEIKVEATSHNLPVEIADRPYLRSRILQLLSKADAEPNSKKRYALLERVRDLSFRLRKQTGFSDWPAIVFAIGCAALLIFGIFRITRAPDLWHVLERASDFNQTLQQIHNGQPQTPVVMHWCPGDPQPFEPGQTLIDLGLEYHPDGYCHTATRFSLLRDAATCPKVPKNCAHTNCADPQSDHIVCEGKPQFD